MAWSWSHTDEGYENAKNNLMELPRETLETIFGEWKSTNKNGEFNESKYNTGLIRAGKIQRYIICDYIWEKSKEFCRCDNGGFKLHMCPFGCDLHKVSLDKNA